ncbi:MULTISPECIES: H-NS family nucleoid-associated regulatory protein [unclassified Variovorax]|uniref:H-NS family nucleoid-associated regulatory protein n=1 Tax=unclassified Variovorax TaxID=663243 RepID=UPI001BD39D44|nr:MULTISPECIES: H-NS family nucleoid-associated regulatory protein [unclassified Variovorax]
MAQSYAQIQKQIASLQRQAEAIRLSELKGVIDRIKVAIAHYGLTPAQLFGSTKSPTSKKTVSVTEKFVDGKGNAWSGRGPRPQWLRDAIAAGANIDDFKPAPVSSAVADKSSTAVASATVKKVKRAASKALYGDDMGNTWTGRGPKPGWLKSGLTAGKDLKDFATQAD